MSAPAVEPERIPLTGAGAASTIWVGEGLLTLPVADGEEISDLAPVRCGKGIRASMAYIVDDLKTLKDLAK